MIITIFFLYTYFKNIINCGKSSFVDFVIYQQINVPENKQREQRIVQTRTLVSTYKRYTTMDELVNLLSHFGPCQLNSHPSGQSPMMLLHNVPNLHLVLVKSQYLSQNQSRQTTVRNKHIICTKCAKLLEPNLVYWCVLINNLSCSTVSFLLVLQ